MITSGMHENVDQNSMYIRHSNSHFDVVLGELDAAVTVTYSVYVIFAVVHSL